MWVGLSREDPARPGDAPDESDRSEDEDEDGEERPQQVVSAHEIRRQVLERCMFLPSTILTRWLTHRFIAYVQEIETSVVD